MFSPCEALALRWAFVALSLFIEGQAQGLPWSLMRANVAA